MSNTRAAVLAAAERVQRLAAAECAHLAGHMPCDLLSLALAHETVATGEVIDRTVDALRADWREAMRATRAARGADRPFGVSGPRTTGQNATPVSGQKSGVCE